MKANVYALIEHRASGTDVYMLCGTQQEAIDYYRKMTGKPGEVDQRIEREGHEHLLLDVDADGGAGYVSQYKVGIQEIIED